jgi:hypothetical protein
VWGVGAAGFSGGALCARPTVALDAVQNAASSTIVARRIFIREFIRLP